MDSLVFSNMLHRPARTIVSVLGIALGVLLIVFTVGLASGSLRDKGKREANVGAEIFFRPSGSIGQSGSDSFRLSGTTVDELKKIEGVRMAVPVGQTSVNSDTGIGSRLIDGINFDEYSQISGLEIVEGRAFQPGTDEAIIDRAYQREKSLKIGDKTQLWDRDFTVVGVYEPAGGARIKIPLLTMQKAVIGEDSAPSSLNRVSTILVQIQKEDGMTEDQIKERTEKVAANIAKVFPDNQLIRAADMEELYLNSFPAFEIFRKVIIGVASVISALVILLTMYTTVTERTRQIGILKSLGMSNGKIAWTITQEAILISALGIATGLILTVVAKLLLMRFSSSQVELNEWVIAITTIVGIVGGALGALYPAYRAARLDAVEALSYE
ncbi:MAG: ABC transporter permease [Pyrinomonadaceae bacterium]|nr:ABC transporter permease [Pyrinomonadaceae bacterium]